MIRGVILTLLLNCYAFLSSQDLLFSRNFEARKKSIPLEIINNHSSYFYVLRLNKAVHDLTIERRAKPSAAIIAFTPLKLDSVNATWFDYEKLDYLFFEHDHKAYFLFEKVLNLKRTIYLKIIDTTGKSSGFIELASLEKDAASTYFDFSYKRTTGHSILIVASKYGVNGITRRVALLFDLRLKKLVWTKKLPLEISATESTLAFECSSQNDLVYLQTKSQVLGYHSYYANDIRYTVPIIKLDSLFFVKWKSDAGAPLKETLSLNGMTNLKNAFILPGESSVFLSIQGLAGVEDSVQACVKNIRLNAKDLSVMYCTTNFYLPAIKEQLTFYDGPEKEFYYKHHALLKNFEVGNKLYTVLDRVEGTYYKEALLWETDLRTGELLSQKILPRKIFYFKNRTRFKSIAEIMCAQFENTLKLFVLENPANINQDPNRYKYKTFKKENSLWGSNIVAYSFQGNNALSKKLVFKNRDFDVIPLRYQSASQKNMMFYLTNGKYEKFAILQMNP